MSRRTRLGVLLALAAALVAANVAVWTRRATVRVGDETDGIVGQPHEAPETTGLAPRPMIRPFTVRPLDSVPIVERVEKIAVVAKITSQKSISLDGFRVEADIVADDVVLAPVGVATTDAAGQCVIGPVRPPSIARSLVPAPPRRSRFLFDPFTLRKPAGHAVLRLRTTGRSDVRVDERTINVSDLAEPSAPEWGPTVVDTDGVRTVTVPLEATTESSIRGRVLDRAGQPLEGAYVHAPGADRYFGEHTDDDGRFLLGLASDGRVRLEVTFPWFDSHPEPVLAREVEVVPGPAVTTVDLVVEPLVTIEGRVEYEDGKPVAGVPLALVKSGGSVEGAIMSMWSWSNTPAPPFHLRTKSAADGTFRFVGLPKDRRLEIRWWDDERDERGGPKDLSAGTKDVVVTVTSRHGVRVRCVDAETAEPVKAEVSIESLDLRISSEEASLSDPGEDGVRGKPGERLRIVARADRYDSVIRDVVVPKEEGISDVLIRLTPARSRALVVVRAVDEDGTPWPQCPSLRWKVADSDARVEPRLAGGGRPGAFVTRDLAPGRYIAKTGDDAVGLPASGGLRFATDGEATIEVPASGEVEAALRARRGGALRVVVVGKDGAAKEPGDMTSLSARNPQGEATLLRLFRQPPATENSNGGWQEGSLGTSHETQALVPGIYTIEWTGGLHHDAPAVASSVVRVLPGTIVDVQIIDPR